jgi:hypothetical protein
MSMSQVHKIFFVDEDEPFITKALLDFQRTALSNIHKDIQGKLIEIAASKANKRGPGGGRGLLQFAAWLFMAGERHWGFLNTKQSIGLSAVASMASWGGAALMRGHDTIATPEDMLLAEDCLKELADYVRGKYAVKLLRHYQAAQKKQLPGFIAALKKADPGTKWDPRSAGVLFNKIMLTRLYDDHIIGLQYGSASVALIGKVMFQL